MTCIHAKYQDGHCGDIICPNYYNKCYRHSYSGNKNEECTLNPTLPVSQEIHTYELQITGFYADDLLERLGIVGRKSPIKVFIDIMDEEAIDIMRENECTDMGITVTRAKEDWKL